MNETRIIAIDFGLKRTGIAVSDPQWVFSFPLATVQTSKLYLWLSDYFSKTPISRIVIGLPLHLNSTAGDIEPHINSFINKIQKSWPNLEVVRVDERFTSVLAQRAIIDAGIRKKKRQNKSLVDKISAALILQTYLEQIKRIEN